MFRSHHVLRLIFSLALAAIVPGAFASYGTAGFYDVTVSWQDFTLLSASPVATSTSTSVRFVDGIQDAAFAGYFSSPDGHVTMTGRFVFDIHIDACTPSQQDSAFFRAGTWIALNVREFFSPMGLTCWDAGPQDFVADFPFSTGWDYTSSDPFTGGLMAQLGISTTIPEPSTCALLVGGLMGLAFASRGKLQQRKHQGRRAA